MCINLLFNTFPTTLGNIKLPNLNEGFSRAATSLLKIFKNMGSAALNGILPGLIESILFNHILKPKSA